MKGRKKVLIGLFLKGIKSYENTIFIPTVKNNKPFSFFIGENGVGKSSILEALDIFFNKTREWNINKNIKKKNEVFIAPVFLLKKSSIDIQDDHKVEYEEYLASITNTLLSWDIQKTSNIKSNSWVNDFYNFLDELKKINNIDDYFIVIASTHYEKKQDNLFFTFRKLIEDNISNYDQEKMKKFFEFIRNLYSYIYIPVETPVDAILRMETNEMQMLLSEDIIKYIEQVLLDKNIKEANKSINIVDKINNKLDSFMLDVNYTISRIDSSYSYTADGKFKKNLTAIDIRDHIFKAYFSLRTLSKSQKDIVQLSSGEKRKALVDIATAFLKQETKRTKNVILAIDEPETSMHMKNVFDQFKQLEVLSVENNIQFIGTTHWYGFLPITDYGNLNHISKEDDTITIRNLDFYNLFERNDNFPDDIEMKSFFELVTSIISSIKSSKYKKWIICEGSDDKKYLEYYLKYNQKNLDLVILPVSGSGNVKKLYHLLYASLSEKDRVRIDGKILCLVDTDLGTFGLNNGISSDNKEKIIFIRRLQINKNKIILEKIMSNTPRHFQTEVEDCLEPTKYYQTLQYVLKDTQVEAIFNSYELNPKCQISRISNTDGESLLQFNVSKGLPQHVNEFKTLTQHLEQDQTKQQICEHYIAHINSKFIPEWIEEIVDLLKLEKTDIPHCIDLTKNVEIANEIINRGDEEIVEETISNDINEEEKIAIKSNSNLNIDLLSKLKESQLKYPDLYNINDYLKAHNQDKLLNMYISNNLMDFLPHILLLDTMINTNYQINFKLHKLIENPKLIKNFYDLPKILLLIFINKNNISDDLIITIEHILNGTTLSHNDSQVNELYFLIYIFLKLEDTENIKLIIEHSELIRFIEAIFTFIHFSSSNQYIQIGYNFTNIIALGNHILNSKTFAPFIDVFIHALKKYDVFDKLLLLDRRKSFTNKLKNYYLNKPPQETNYNKIFNQIFPNFDI